MSLFRLIVACLVMAALPLQGLAAASMLFCGQANPAAGARVMPHGMQHRAVHDHASHGHAGHDHASHGHASHNHASHDHASHDHQSPTAQAVHAGVASADAPAADGHSCPICAACNLVALSGAPALALATETPATLPPASPVRVLTRTAPAPDKPPRA